MSLTHIPSELRERVSQQAHHRCGYCLTRTDVVGTPAASDPETGELVRLFGPRRQHWHKHFTWNETSDIIAGISPTGRATVVALYWKRLLLVRVRRGWVQVGWHPPDTRSQS